MENKLMTSHDLYELHVPFFHNIAICFVFVFVICFFRIRDEAQRLCLHLKYVNSPFEDVWLWSVKAEERRRKQKQTDVSNVETWLRLASAHKLSEVMRQGEGTAVKGKNSHRRGEKKANMRAEESVKGIKEGGGYKLMVWVFRKDNEKWHHVRKSKRGEVKKGRGLFEVKCGEAELKD